MSVDNFLDIYSLSLNKKGEELCGDKVKYLKGEKRTIIVLSDGLGSGVKANILATLTTEILINMLSADVPLEEVLKTTIATLPICKVRKIAYSTFTIIRINHETSHFKVINFDNPDVIYLKQGHTHKLDIRVEKILDKKIKFAEGVLERGDFLAAISDGVLYAGLGVELNFGWGWDNISQYLEGVLLQRAHNSRVIVRDVINKTHSLYHGEIGDDATFVGVYVRKRNPLIIFTGPPLDESKDELYVEKFLNFEGRKVICGGTTGNIVANYLGDTIEMDIATMRRDLPPIGFLNGVDLLTEGILTISKATEYIKSCQGDIGRLPFDANGAYFLAKEILEADSILFLVGQKINEFYQNPLLPKNISIRRSLIEDLVKFLRDCQKEVQIEYC
ncbi:serine/threonine-protein phosphatase [Trichothermofontia sichuanensis B231]|uniref:SpoIIE family protein phosphatase n=1 Tax=Trichothermofontia sichuanensis TaxID=3045816 RepID=UPI00224613B0|nr:SpoIIE family protein phosphatase [Trichothermofontia sichuanensis]UZQ55750.1 serine/threonine-protein phosphatase [Trichothermofontia sichuanensis B231]